jgi:phosphatidylethanolamine/phosphatidyl-N-methylethanolamine N-methyltransferase
VGDRHTQMMRDLDRCSVSRRIHSVFVGPCASASPRIDSALELETQRRDAQLEETRQHYDRIAPFYDVFEAVVEIRARRWRRSLWERAGAGRILEVGVGTGKNLPYYPPGVDVTAIDVSEGMLERAVRRAARLGTRVSLQVADAQALPYPDATFDTVVATFVFCTVSDPVRGLREARRVLAPGGRILLLEHVLSRRPTLRRVMRWFDSIATRLFADHVDRETVDLVREAGFVDVVAQHRALDVVKQIEARAPSRNGGS